MMIKYSALIKCRLLHSVILTRILCSSASNHLNCMGINPHVQTIRGTHSLHIEKNHATTNLKEVQYIDEERLFIPKCYTNRTEIRKAQKE